MPSLTKVKSKDADKWIEKNKGPYLISDKLDGASLEITSDKKKYTGIFTRGNGTVGQDVLHLAPYIKLPDTPDMDVRGELIVSDEKFKQIKDKSKRGSKNSLYIALVSSN